MAIAIASDRRQPRSLASGAAKKVRGTGAKTVAVSVSVCLLVSYCVWVTRLAWAGGCIAGVQA